MTEIKEYSPKGILMRAPMAGRVYTVQQKQNGEWVTGLSKEQETRLSTKLGKDLSSHSDFWSDYTMKFSMPTLTMFKDEKTPEGELFITVAKANKYLANDEDELLSDMELKNNTSYYIHDTKELEKKKSKLNEIKIEVGALIHEMRNNKDKMLFILHKLGKFVTETLREEALFNSLAAEIEKLKKFEQFERFRSVLKTPNVELQAYYFTKMGLKYNIILMDYEIGQHKFQEKTVGKTESDVVKFFTDKKNEAQLVALANEYRSKVE